MRGLCWGCAGAVWQLGAVGADPGALCMQGSMKGLCGDPCRGYDGSTRGLCRGCAGLCGGVIALAFLFCSSTGSFLRRFSLSCAVT